MSGHAAAAAVRTVVPAGLAIAAFLLITMSPVPAAGYAVVCAALLASAAGAGPGGGAGSGGGAGKRMIRGVPQLGDHLTARLLAAAAVLVLAAQQTTGTPWLLLTGAALLGTLLAEPLLHRLARPWYVAARLPGPPSLAAAAVTNGTVWAVNTVAIALVGLAAVLAWSAAVVSLPALVAAVAGVAVAADGLRRWRSGHRAELAALRRAVQRHQPRFLLYFSAPPGSEYQATMWLPHLHRLDEHFLVVLAEGHNLPAIARATDAPVLVHRTFEALDAVMVPTLRAAFYVNNGMKNAHCVRFTQLTHIQLYHGDSDKAVTASPLNKMYDKVFVAGQAAVDRFAHYGVDLPADRFVLVGRPQVADLAVADQPVAAVEDKTVLYAPTWAGAHADSNYCSLPIAAPIIEGLLARGVRVILRAHPYAAGDRRTADDLRRAEQLLARDQARTGRAHRWGDDAMQLGLFGCMDAADAMICDVSAVASDFLYTGKPFAITDMVGAGEAFTGTFPVARAAYVLDREAGNLAAVLDDLLEDDPLAPTRRKLRTYYLGDAPPERYADVFVDEARRFL